MWQGAERQDHNECGKGLNGDITINVCDKGLNGEITMYVARN